MVICTLGLGAYCLECRAGMVMSNDFCSNVAENSEKDLCDTGISLVFLFRPVIIC